MNSDGTFFVIDHAIQLMKGGARTGAGLGEKSSRRISISTKILTDFVASGAKVVPMKSNSEIRSVYSARPTV
jgi:hypothetical protein